MKIIEYTNMNGDGNKLLIYKQNKQETRRATQYRLPLF